MLRPSQEAFEKLARRGNLIPVVREIVADQGLAGPQAIGPIMREMMARYKGQADGGLINRLAREVLAEAEADNE